MERTFLLGVSELRGNERSVSDRGVQREYERRVAYSMSSKRAEGNPRMSAPDWKHWEEAQKIDEG